MNPDLKLIVLLLMTCLFFSMTEGQTKTADINERKDEGKNQIIANKSYLYS